MTDVLSALQGDFKLFLQALWDQLDLPSPTRAQYAIADYFTPRFDTNCFVSLYGKIKPEKSKCSPTRSGGLYVDRGRYFTVPMNKQAVSRLLPGDISWRTNCISINIQNPKCEDR